MESNKEIFMRKTIVVWFGAMICCALWGSAFPCIKIGYRMFGIMSDAISSQILFAGCRFILAGILVIAAGSLLNRKALVPTKGSWPKILKLSSFQTVAQYLFFYIGLAHTTGVKGSIIIGMNVFISILVASLIFRQERMTASKVSGCAIGFAGVVLVNITKSGIDMNMSFLGEGFILLTTVAYAFSSAYMKQLSREEDPVMLSGYQFFAGGIILAAGGFLMGGRIGGFTLSSTMMLLYLAFISAAGYTIWSVLLKYNPVSRVSVFGFMNPVFGVVFSALLLGEKAQAFGPKNIAALFLVCIGIYVVNKIKIETVEKKLLSEEKTQNC